MRESRFSVRRLLLCSSGAVLLIALGRHFETVLSTFGGGLRENKHVSSSSLQSFTRSKQDAAQLGLQAIEDFVVPTFASSDARKTPNPTVENRISIEQILKANISTWDSYKRMTTINGTVLKHYTGKETVDVTRNVPRIEDFTTDHPLQTEAQRNLDTEAKRSTVKINKSNLMNQDEKARNEPLNIVLFYADDWTMKVLGKLNPFVNTPNIDEMADRGMIFTRNCVTTSICWISRNTLATGLYAAVHKNLKIMDENMFNVTVPWLETLYPLLKSHRYYTGLMGKWHAPAPDDFMKHTFDQFESYYGDHWFERDNKLRHVTDWNRYDSIRFLHQRPKDRKFALTISFFATHAVDGDTDHPYQPMKESFTMYQNITVPRPKTATEKHWRDLPWFFTRENEGRQRWIQRFDKQNYQEKIKNLYRMATEVDTVVGDVIRELKKQGVYNKTLLVFTTDNGNLHGEHGLAEKWYPFEESIRVPLVIQDPRMPASTRGTRNDDFTLSIDLAPTLLAAANIQPPKFMQGRDIAELYLNREEAKRTWRQDFFYEWTQGNPVDAEGHRSMYHIPAVFALIRKDYKYFYWPQAQYEQLFRIETDPYEENDIMKDKDLNSTVQTTTQALQLMRARYLFLKKWAQSGNPV